MILLILATSMLAGCLNPRCDSRFTYDCLYDAVCVSGSDGICLFDGETGKYCSYPDADCPSGRRWSLARVDTCGCVAPELLRDMRPAMDAAVTE